MRHTHLEPGSVDFLVWPFFSLPRFTGTRDKSGRAVAIITTRNTAWLNPHCNTTELVRLLLYLHSIPRFVMLLGWQGGQLLSCPLCLSGVCVCVEAGAVSGTGWLRWPRNLVQTVLKLYRWGSPARVNWLVFSKLFGYSVCALCTWCDRIRYLLNVFMRCPESKPFLLSVISSENGIWELWWGSHAAAPWYSVVMWYFRARPPSWEGGRICKSWENLPWCLADNCFWNLQAGVCCNYSSFHYDRLSSQLISGSTETLFHF